MSNDTPRVSIGLPVFNGAQFLGETLQSILTQTHSDFELVISDNASSDRTEEICREYAVTDKRIRYFRNQTNLGAGRNYNRVFALSSGEYFKWAAADDSCKPEYLARCVEALDGDPSVAVAYPRATFIDASGRAVDERDPGWDLRSPAPHQRLRYVIYSGHWCNAIFGLIRRSALAQTSLMGNYTGQDYRLLGELSLAGKFFEIPEYLFLRRLHPRASSQNMGLEWQLEFYDPASARRRMCLPLWTRSLGHLFTIVRSDLKIGQKAYLTGHLLRMMRWRRDTLLREFRAAAGRLCRAV